MLGDFSFDDGTVQLVVDKVAFLRPGLQLQVYFCELVLQLLNLLFFFLEFNFQSGLILSSSLCLQHALSLTFFCARLQL